METLTDILMPNGQAIGQGQDDPAMRTIHSVAPQTEVQEILARLIAEAIPDGSSSSAGTSVYRRPDGATITFMDGAVPTILIESDDVAITQLQFSLVPTSVGNPHTRDDGGSMG